MVAAHDRGVARQTADSAIFKRHFSGYTQAAAIAAMVSKVLKPDLVISFGTAGGVHDPPRQTTCDAAALFVSQLGCSSLGNLLHPAGAGPGDCR